MPETHYRASRVCRIMGNPTAYEMIRILYRKEMTPSQIASEMGISLTLASATLRILRNIDLIRYEAKGKGKIYWMNDKTIPGICAVLEKFVARMRHKRW